MKLVMARAMGFCNGVKRAITVASAALAASGNAQGVAVTGPLVHNHQVTDALEAQGLHVLETDDEIPPETTRVVIRAHGITDARRKKLECACLDIYDATCPLVSRAQDVIRTQAGKGRHIVVVGVPSHGETVSMMGVDFPDGTPIHASLVSSVEGVASLPVDKALTVMVQSTFPQKEWNVIEKTLKERSFFQDVEFGNAICPASVQRRKAVEELCDSCDAIVVIGGRHSSNTVALTEIVAERKLPVFHVENADEVPVLIVGYKIVGITAGASTPKDVITAVCSKLRFLADSQTTTSPMDSALS
ncbi:4-hydroxy-3-methylbut-2-enyl diphosphate reductase [Parasphaerochaeta coccoides DSM 17374]|uniref:4-hydroxy-3-methylbut-2-enyl diphosphate reductase n=2 Tax=Parasphaerochaeta TaxID=3062336 RepID=F4GKP1_PARC1|nr:4-hydroxy-3-methylbut-2-enyl diphosphate reductase [Parasphaerochaeta coccoides DSM 17374]